MYKVRMRATFLPLFLITALWSYLALGQHCDPVDFNGGTVVCKCNSTYCDFYPDPAPPSRGKYIWYTTSKAGKRLERKDGHISSSVRDNYIRVKINAENQFQTIEGFGGAFTDAAGINIKSLSSKTQNHLMRSYFSRNGSGYNFGRVPIAGNDFSTRGYTYDDTDGDITLSHFNLTIDDTEYKIPLMQEARKLNPELRFVSAAWTAPLWMKDKQIFCGVSTLLEEYYQVYANYLVKFLEEYKKNGLDIWAVSTGNEPFTTYSPNSPVTSMYWSPEKMANWVANNLGPSVRKSTSNSTSILILDDQRTYVPWYVNYVKSANSKALDYVKGIAIHWYADDYIPVGQLDSTHDDFPDKFILMSEACLGANPWDYPKVILGSWSRADNQIIRMFENLNHWVVGWIDWNLALNLQGGPTWTNNYLDSPIIVDAKKDVFYKQPYYYVMTHFSKFVPRNSIRIQAESSNNDILTLAFETNDDQKVVLLYNTSDDAKNVSVVDGNSHVNVELPEYSLHTILYKK